MSETPYSIPSDPVRHWTWVSFLPAYDHSAFSNVYQLYLKYYFVIHLLIAWGKKTPIYFFLHLMGMSKKRFTQSVTVILLIWQTTCLLLVCSTAHDVYCWSRCGALTWVATVVNTFRKRGNTPCDSVSGTAPPLGIALAMLQYCHRKCQVEAQRPPTPYLPTLTHPLLPDDHSSTLDELTGCHRMLGYSYSVKISVKWRASSYQYVLV